MDYTIHYSVWKKRKEKRDDLLEGISALVVFTLMIVEVAVLLLI